MKRGKVAPENRPLSFGKLFHPSVTRPRPQRFLSGVVSTAAEEAKWMLWMASKLWSGKWS